LKVGSDEIVAVGEAYESKASAKNGVESVKKNAAGATVADLTESRPALSSVGSRCARSLAIPAW
jgi:hypothetical protein